MCIRDRLYSTLAPLCSYSLYSTLLYSILLYSKYAMIQAALRSGMSPYSLRRGWAEAAGHPRPPGPHPASPPP
eukprot:2143554-Pyramimonas_sp.AAC.1